MSAGTARVASNPPVNRSTINGTAGINGTHGYATPPHSPTYLVTSKTRPAGTPSGKSRVSSLSQAVRRNNPNGSYKVSVVQETATTLKRKSMSELGAGVSQTANDSSFIDLVEWIRSERLATVPHKGSTWDKVLIRALHFIEQLHNFERAVQSFASDSDAAAQLGYGHTRLLLELGHENSEALDRALGFFYKCSLSVSSLLNRSGLLSVVSETQEQLCLMYTDLLTLVVEVSIRFYKTVHGMLSSEVSLDMHEVFGDTIETFRSRQDKITETLWSYQINSEGFSADEALDIRVLGKWLAPQDRVLAALGRDHTTFTDQQAEFTCLWFQDDLTKFLKGPDSFMLVNGQSGSGKTTLAAAVSERLQRRLGRKSYSSLFCPIGSVPSQATTLHVVKTILYHLLNMRVGNMHLYRTLAQAYEHARSCADPKVYEQHLWNALADILRHPLDDADDLVMVIDGLDELVGGKPAGQDLLENLTRITGQGKRVKLIGLSQSLSMPSAVRGTQLIISREDTRDDIHAVIIKALMHCRHFNRKPGPEQESTIGRIIDASEGSFLRATLTCEVLKAEKTQDSFTKAVQTLQSSRPSVHDLVTRIVSVLEPSDDSKWLLSWLVDAARPLTYDEIESLFRTDVQRGVHSDKRVDLHSVTQTLRPLLSTHEDIVCVRHGLVHTALRTLFDQAKLPLPVKDRQMAFLLRALTYVKSTLRETIEPTLDNRDQGLPNKLFQRHPFLEYVIRYWPSHLKQTPIVPTKSGDANVPDEVKKAFPESTAMPILEWLCWDDQFPGAQEVDLHILVSRLRRHVFSENHPSVMQSYINCATYFELMKHSAEAGRYYFQAMNISLTVLSTFHPLTVECATRYLRLTEPLVTTSRTDIMTRREKVLNILITAYERQFGSTSDLVITTRQLLAEFYMHIHEEDRATEVLRIIHGTTSGKNGKDTDHARGISEHLRIKLGKAKGDRDLETYNPLFTDEDDEETVVSLDLGQIAVIIRKAESYLSQGKTSLAEQTYVELWQQLSESCRTTRAVEWHEKKIDTVIAYAKFLKTQKRESEASAFLTCLWQEYEHHELAFSESIISRLTETARMMKSVGQYSAALSIFKHVSSFFSTVRKEDSRSISQIEEEIAITSTEVVKHTLSSSSSTENTNTASASTFEEIFHSMITNQYKSVDSTVIMLAKRLTTLYMEQGKWSEAISTIQSTLQRTWSSFSAVSIHGVSYTSTFWQESVELAQLLAECYVHQRLLEKVEDVYVRLFRAVLSAPAKDNTPLLEKVTSLLVSFYDKHGYPDRAISVFQEVLVVYRTRLGPVHDVTIQTLYTLADRCRRHARSHPYWIEYCQQIVTSLNKDADICHANAMKALVFVANSYWEERRHAEAVTVFSILWNTFINRTKEYEQFKDTKFVSELYERYFQCLEETKADWEVLYRVTKQYRETCSKAFGASVAITTTATLALARISQRSESHTDEAISWYEEASKSSSSSSDTSISSTDIKQTLSTLYKRRILSQSSTASSETVQRATTIYEEQFSEARAKYGYTYEMTLSNLKELSMLYTRQQKTDIAMKELTTAVVEINTKETSLQKMLESATSIAQTFQACKLTQRCTELILELHRQIIAKEVKNSKFSFNLTKCGSASLMFLAALEYHIRTDLSITFSEIMSNISAESVYYENFRRVMVVNDSLEKVLVAAAPLRHFLLRMNRKDMVSSVEDQIVQLYAKRYIEDVQLMSKDSPRTFIVGILDYLANHKTADFVRAVILASNKTVAGLVKNKRFKEAYDVAEMAFRFAQQHKGYHGPRAISRGFELASYLDGRGENRCTDEGLRKQLLQLSSSIIKEILQVCRDQKINFAQVQLPELNQVIALLGEQQDYKTLEWLLNTLWNNREAQRAWPPQVLLNLGRRLVCARYLAKHSTESIRLCEDIVYNMRRVYGARHPVTLETCDLLAQLYTSTGQQCQSQAAHDKSAALLAGEYFKKAIFVYEDVLRWLVAGRDGDGSADADDEDEDTAAAILMEHGVTIDEDGDGVQDEDQVDRAALAKQHLRLLKFAFQRLGAWPKQYNAYEKLNADVFATFGAQLQGVEGVEKWSPNGFGKGKAESTEGAFGGVKDWQIASVPFGVSSAA